MGFAYGEYKPNNWFVNGGLSYGGSKYDEKKYALGTHYDAKYDAHIASAAAMTGYQYGIFRPEAGLRYYHIKQSGYTDTAGRVLRAIRPTSCAVWQVYVWQRTSVNFAQRLI